MAFQKKSSPLRTPLASKFTTELTVSLQPIKLQFRPTVDVCGFLPWFFSISFKARYTTSIFDFFTFENFRGRGCNFFFAFCHQMQIWGRRRLKSCIFVHCIRYKKSVRLFFLQCEHVSRLLFYIKRRFFYTFRHFV